VASGNPRRFRASRNALPRKHRGHLAHKNLPSQQLLTTTTTARCIIQRALAGVPIVTRLSPTTKRKLVLVQMQSATMASNATPPMLAHMQYHFAAPPGTQRCWHVERRTFQDLLQQEPRIVIPIFQRTFCWADAQFAGWWKDLLQARGDMMSGHSVGKLMFKRHAISASDPSSLFCIDGQQRITTTMLTLAALRDAALQLPPALVGSPAVMQVVQRLEGVMYSNLGAFAQLKASTGSLQARLPRGQLQRFSRLHPSYRDRAPFFELITLGALKAKDQSLELSSETVSTVLYRAKHFFDQALQAHLAAQSSDTHRVNVLRDLTGRALDFFSVMYVECIAEVNLPQLFLWLQEKALFGMGALLYNPTPGVKFNMCDMVRNLLMSSFSDLPYPEQERLYNDLWLVPLENLHPNPDDLDAVFRRFLDAREVRHSGDLPSASLPALPPNFGFPGRPGRYVGSFESGLVSLICGMALKMDVSHLTPAMLYARFQSYFELALKTSLLGESPSRIVQRVLLEVAAYI
jgi:hypothetical protein